MTTVLPTSTLPLSAGDAATPLQAAARAPESTATLSADFDTFLQMLTAQARFQDPLDPVSSSDYAAQLAQFSMVEQQVFTNDQLGALTDALGGTTIATLANWVGMEARAPASVAFDGQPVTVSPAPAEGADRAQLVVRNDFGGEVARLNLPLSNAPFTWDGRDRSGAMAGNGLYSFDVESFVGEELIGTQPAEAYARVIEAQVVNGETVLKLQGGANVLANQVTALREPGS